MSLRTQLLAISLLLLSLPWAGCEYLREMERTLRAGQGMAAEATARAIAGALRDRKDLLYPTPARLDSQNRASWYVPASRRPLVSDGYDEDWREQHQLVAVAGTGPGVRLRLATVAERLFIYVDVDDHTLRYRTPTASQAPNGDRLELWCRDALGALGRYSVAGEAPGGVRGVNVDGNAGGFADLLRGALRERLGGYSLELQLPLDRRCERLAIRIIDAGGGEDRVRYDSRDSFAGQLPWLVYRVSPLNLWLGAFGEAGRSLEVRDRDGLSIGVFEALNASVDDRNAETFWLLRWLYRAVLAYPDSDPPSDELRSGWQLRERAGNSASGGAGGPVLEAAAAVNIDGAQLASVQVTETTERYLALTDRASSRLLVISAGAIALALLALLGYASLLSWRIRKLRDAAGKVAKDPTAAGSFPRSRARDELGELSRSYADLLRQIGEYNQYLRGLARSLSHELRTPIAVVGSSLDNLGRAGLSAGEQNNYTQRARDGLKRLARIVTAMSEASRIEESLQGSEFTPVDLRRMLRELFDAYASSFAPQEFTLALTPDSLTLEANGELLAQALDKLVENAVSFAAPGSAIALAARRHRESIEITVSNEGPPLPEALRERLFEPMVTIRGTEKSDDSHLGIGLHIARSIAGAHGGNLRGENLDDGSGVVFTLTLPLRRDQD